MSLFRLDASIMPASSASAELADLVEAEWSAARPGEPVVRRHLGTDPLPAGAWTLATTAGFVPEDQRSPAQRDALALAAALKAELTDADAVLLAVPLYNYGVSQHFKAWVDLVIAAAGPADAGVLKDKPTVLVTVRGGGYGPGTPREGWDHSTPYLRRILADMWQADLTVVERELTLVGVNPVLDHLKDLAAQRHAEARDTAHHTGRALAAE
ncbi:NAD(P)H-dependent oxidoreductase [Acrocarpospora macrocephala]|uniref:FMN dependent NADH:quinone oxidoreductase n=1 Tax=Acrocarpospora macrocephala TaxID=150177 RepID=A0A5M3WVV4_9ACTN|nr:NAD(P)H-dependent oxidoreductase [Acrocarpospora macrocephala]GES11451.1 FMN-dependent NADH-azoreductase [Acrocarpospora macrocephala]